MAVPALDSSQPNPLVSALRSVHKNADVRVTAADSPVPFHGSLHVKKFDPPGCSRSSTSMELPIVNVVFTGNSSVLYF